MFTKNSERYRPSSPLLLKLVIFGSLAGTFVSQAAYAGPPFFTDDPWTTKKGHHELFLYTDATTTDGGSEGNIGIDYAYGISSNLELAMVVPVSYENADGEPSENGIANVVLAGKYLFSNRGKDGLSIAFGPSISLPSLSSSIGDDRASLTLPFWVGSEGERWTTFGGGGCTLTRNNDSKNYCFAGLAATTRLSPNLEAGLEIFYQTKDSDEGKASTGMGIGLTYGLNEKTSILLYAGTGVRNHSETNEATGYFSLLFTF